MEIATKLTVARTLNFAIIVLEVYATILSAINYGWGMFRYFTDLSNILALITSALFLITSFRPQFPNWLKYAKLFSAVCLSITFIVVCFVLCPLSGGMGAEFMLLFGSMFYHHLVCPIVFVVSFLFFEPYYHYSTKDAFTALIPVFTYAAIILTLNILKKIVGPYQFLYIYEQSVWVTILWCVIIALITLVLGTLFTHKSKADA